MGFVYFSDEEDAPEYVGLESRGDFGANVGGSWSHLFRFQWERELKPSEAVAQLDIGGTAGEGWGRFIPGSATRTAPSARELRTWAELL